jgi:putative chitinase
VIVGLDQLVAAGIKPEVAQRWVQPVQAACAEFDISTPKRVAAFLAQTAHESGGFVWLSENLNYSAEALMKIWPKRFPTIEFARRFHRQPELIANAVYASRMGNGGPETGDGWRYRGRGLKQLTGKDNYTRCGRTLNVDLVGDPDLLLRPGLAARSAGWFWSSSNCGPLADDGQFELLTKRINGGLIGLKDRKERYAKTMASLQQGMPVQA